MGVKFCYCHSTPVVEYQIECVLTPRDAQRGESDRAESVLGRGLERSSSGIMLSMGLLLGQPEMGVVVVRADRSGVELEVRAEERLRVPNWFGKAVLLGQYPSIVTLGVEKSRRNLQMPTLHAFGAWLPHMTCNL
jgi:hypothetical protein